MVRECGTCVKTESLLYESLRPTFTSSENGFASRSVVCSLGQFCGVHPATLI